MLLSPLEGRFIVADHFVDDGLWFVNRESSYEASKVPESERKTFLTKVSFIKRISMRKAYD